MPYTYYWALDARQKATYRRSDAIAAIRLPSAATLRPLVEKLAQALSAGKRPGVVRAAQALIDALVERLGVPPLRVKVLSKRPSNRSSELHGLYEPVGRRQSAVVTVWMRTAAKRQIVAFRTFLRTLVHELCHHLDYEMLSLADSFHTQGFFKRESSVVKQLLGARTH